MSVTDKGFAVGDKTEQRSKREFRLFEVNPIGFEVLARALKCFQRVLMRLRAFQY